MIGGERGPCAKVLLLRVVAVVVPVISVIAMTLTVAFAVD